MCNLIINFICSLTIPQIFVLWSVAGVIPYQLTFLVKMFKERPNQLRCIHFTQAVPFGLIVLLSLCMTWVLVHFKIIKLKGINDDKED